MNWIDLFIVILVVYFALRAYWHGFIYETLNLASLILAFFVSFFFYHPLSIFLATHLPVPISFANVLAFSVIFFTLIFLYYILFIFYADRIPEKWQKARWNQFTGIIPGLVKGFLATWILLSLFLIIPFFEPVKKQINDSIMASPITKNSPLVENFINRVFGHAVSDTLDFLTVKPESSEIIDLGFKVANPKVDTESEQKMLDRVNAERTSRGLKPLIMDEKLREVARAHSRDMFKRGYFAHNTPEGLTPFDRMDKVKIKYAIAGENLALAPDVEIAHNGLMNSPGHRANILAPEYQKVGIGCLVGGIYGRMFSQEFTD